MTWHDMNQKSGKVEVPFMRMTGRSSVRAGGTQYVFSNAWSVGWSIDRSIGRSVGPSVHFLPVLRAVSRLSYRFTALLTQLCRCVKCPLQQNRYQYYACPILCVVRLFTVRDKSKMANHTKYDCSTYYCNAGNESTNLTIKRSKWCESHYHSNYSRSWSSYNKRLGWGHIPSFAILMGQLGNRHRPWIFSCRGCMGDMDNWIKSRGRRSKSP